MPNSINKKQPRIIQSLAFILGFTSVIGQILLLRELITVFYGNETAYALILASWLFWVAAGSYTASWLSSRIQKPLLLITILQYAVFFVLPLTILAARCINQIMHVQTGEIIGIIPMCIAVYLLLAPLTFLLGALFTLICRFSDLNKTTQESSDQVSSIYLWEATGAAVGGLIFSFIFVHIFPALYTALIVGVLNIGVVLFAWRKTGDAGSTASKIPRYTGLIVLLLTFVMAACGGINKLDDFSRRIQWKGFEIVTSTDSIYGNITLAKLGDEYSLYENGLFSFSTKDALTSEESVHFPLLEHPAPRRVLLIGNGMSGSLREILKHPGTTVDYVELDSKVIEVSRNHLPVEYTAPLRDSRVQVFYTDARLFIKRVGSDSVCPGAGRCEDERARFRPQAGERGRASSADTPRRGGASVPAAGQAESPSDKYDVVIVNLSDPYTALLNRYYSLEFFQETNDILNAGGILALSVSSSENYLNKETQAFLRSINSTLKQVFPDVKSIPGDSNIFLAGKKAHSLTLDHQVFVQRLKERKITTQYVREYYLPFRLSEDRIAYIEDVLKEEGALNTDTHPIAYLYDIILWSTHFNTTFKKFVEKIQGIPGYYLLLLPLFLLAGGLLLKRFSPTAPITLSIITTGFSEIIFQVIVILAFQTLYGYAYYKIGLIISSFMMGLVLGSLFARKCINRFPKNIMPIYRTTQAGICLYPLILPFVFVIFRDTVSTQHFTGLFASVFAVLPVIAGFLGGVQYPLATHLVYSKKGKGEGAAKSAGFLYAMDVLGATAGALLTGAILVPLYGITAVALFCAGLNAVVLILLFGKK